MRRGLLLSSLEVLTTGIVEKAVPLNSRAVMPTGISEVNTRMPVSGKDTFGGLPNSSLANFATCCIGPIVKLGRSTFVPEELFTARRIVAGVRFGLMTETPVLTNNGRAASAAAVAAGLFCSSVLRGPVNEFAPLFKSTMTAPLVVNVVAGSTAV